MIDVDIDNIVGIDIHSEESIAEVLGGLRDHDWSDQRVYDLLDRLAVNVNVGRWSRDRIDGLRLGLRIGLALGANAGPCDDPYPPEAATV